MLKLSEASTRALLADLPQDLPEERFDVLLETPAFRLERILSRGHATPEGQWYDQDWHEWVLLLQGQARLAIERREGETLLQPGDAVLLPAHCRHRVNWTPEDTITVWLALHYGANFAPEPAMNALKIGENA
jgi:cupin 2 domain-containing protein